MAETTPRERRQLMRYAFYKLDPAWRRLPALEQREHKAAFAEAVETFGGRLLVRSYSLVGMRGDVDFLLWQVAEDLETLLALQSERQPDPARRPPDDALQLPRGLAPLDLRDPAARSPAPTAVRRGACSPARGATCSSTRS